MFQRECSPKFGGNDYRAALPHFECRLFHLNICCAECQTHRLPLKCHIQQGAPSCAPQPCSARLIAVRLLSDQPSHKRGYVRLIEAMIRL